MSHAQPPSASLPGEGREVIPGAGITKVRVLPQNWSDSEANKYYNTTQGSQMLPYAWFLHLEQADSTVLFRDNANMGKLGFIPRKPDANGNDDGLPVGFVKNGNQVGLNCANCHTGQINYKGTTLLVDGAPTTADSATMLTQLEAALRATQTDPAKFDRFAAAVLGTQNNEVNRGELKKDLDLVVEIRGGYNARNFPHAGETAFGPGRIDAFGAILNEVAVRFAKSPSGVAPVNAPVSFPFLWDTPQHDFVQWNGSAENKIVPLLEPIIGTRHLGALGRNIGEVLGVFGDVNTDKQEFPLRGYASSVNIPNLIGIEESLRALWSPQWPEDLFEAPKSDLVEAGETLYASHCARCHEILTSRTDPHRTVTAKLSDEGTDQTMARNVATRTAPSGILQGRRMLSPPFRQLRATEPVAVLLEHVAQRVVFGTGLVDANTEAPLDYVFKADIGQGSSKLSMGLSHLNMKADLLVSAGVKSLLGKNANPGFPSPASSLGGEKPKVTVSVDPDSDSATSLKVESNPGAAETVKLFYKARPLNGIWATAPYLHNGSVPNLEELLKPAAQRVKTFKVGSREFDPEKVGFVDEGAFVLDTRAPGNSNAGHEYGTRVFTEAERAQLIAFLKTL